MLCQQYRHAASELLDEQPIGCNCMHVQELRTYAENFGLDLQEVSPPHRPDHSHV